MTVDQVEGLDVLRDGAVLRITLQRPEKRNAMTLPMFDGVTRRSRGRGGRRHRACRRPPRRR